MTDENHPLLTNQEKRRLRDAKIRSFYNVRVNGRRIHSMDDVVRMMAALGPEWGVSKRTVFLAVHNRPTRKALEKRNIRRKLKN